MVLACVTAAVHGDEPRNEQAATPRSPTDAVDPVLAAKIRQWIVQLDDDQYTVRKRAQSELESTGLAALDQVAEVARFGPLESSTRGLNILLSWSESADTNRRIRALERIALLENRKTESELAAKLLARLREQAAQRAIVAYGGRVARDEQLPWGPRVVAPVRVTIGEQWKGGVIGLRQLTVIQGLTTVSFYSAPLDDTAVAVLPQLSSVKRVQIYGSGVSSQAIERLAEKMSKEVVWDIRRSGAQLGVKGNVNARQASIEAVVSGSAAETAGLQAGDIVLKVEDTEVADFTELTQQISKHQPGSTVVLKLSRKGETLEKEVTFDRWGIDSLEQAHQAKVKISIPIVPPPNNLQLDRR